MENERLYEREGHFDAFTDLLFNALLGFAFMFFIAFLLINPDAEAGKVELKAEFIIIAFPVRPAVEPATARRSESADAPPRAGGRGNRDRTRTGRRTATALPDHSPGAP